MKHNTAFRVVIPDLHYAIHIEEINEELMAKDHMVRNIINIRSRITKKQLMMFFADLVVEPQENKTFFKQIS